MRTWVKDSRILRRVHSTRRVEAADSNETTRPDKQKSERRSHFRSGGKGGIRTHGTENRTPDFESGAFDHSATFPGRVPQGDFRGAYFTSKPGVRADTNSGGAFDAIQPAHV